MEEVHTEAHKMGRAPWRVNPLDASAGTGLLSPPQQQRADTMNNDDLRTLFDTYGWVPDSPAIQNYLLKAAISGKDIPGFTLHALKQADATASKMVHTMRAQGVDVEELQAADHSGDALFGALVRGQEANAPGGRKAAMQAQPGIQPGIYADLGPEQIAKAEAQVEEAAVQRMLSGRPRLDIERAQKLRTRVLQAFAEFIACTDVPPSTARTSVADEGHHLQAFLSAWMYERAR